MEYNNYSKLNVFKKTYIFYGSLLVLLMVTGIMVFLNNTINAKIVFGTLIIFTIYLLLINVGTGLSMESYFNMNIDDNLELNHILDLYDNINDNEDISFLVIDPDDGEIINANKGAEIFYGCSRSEMLSLNVKDISSISKELLQKKLGIARKQKLPISHTNHRLPTGEIKEVEVYCGPVSIGSKELVYAFVLEPSMKRNFKN
ncbi:hypothetical protein SH2C18_46550 [Clostridium sediminicola]|uniref:PAS domain S-box protein n=1 Tax=Clostridium sediminicola TaxID=3114879 RepID=UPI0031F2612B